MHYSEIKNNDIANGTGVRVTLFVSGCDRHCKNCFNPETWNRFYGKEFTSQTEDLILHYMKPKQIEGLTLLGGEPMMEYNWRSLHLFVKKVKEIFPDKNIWCYTGYKVEELLGAALLDKDFFDFLHYIDVLVDGEFIEDLKDIALDFRGSSNQRILDTKATLEKGKAIVMEGFK